MENKELLPCPFCGGEAEVWSHHYEEKDITLWQVRCKKRPYEAESACYASESFISFETEEEAVEAWNTRSLTFPDEVQEAQHHLCELERITGEAWRPERTCKYIWDANRHVWFCSECGGLEPCSDSVNYCCDCGAKVIGNVE